MLLQRVEDFGAQAHGAAYSAVVALPRKEAEDRKNLRLQEAFARQPDHVSTFAFGAMEPGLGHWNLPGTCIDSAVKAAEPYLKSLLRHRLRVTPLAGPEHVRLTAFAVPPAKYPNSG